MGSDEEREAEIERRVNDKILVKMRNELAADSDAAYRSSLNRLWAANGAGVGIIASAKSIDTASYLIPLVVFIAGLLALSLGEVIELSKKWRRLSEVERVDSWLDLRAGSFESPTEKVGFSVRNAQTISGIVAAASFGIGTIWSRLKLAP